MTQYMYNPVFFENVSFRFSATSPVLFENVMLNIGHGEIVALRGKNGEGKSTLGRLITGDIIPTKGLVRLYGRNPRQLDRIPEVGIISEPLNRETGTFPADLTAAEILQWNRLLNQVNENQVIKQMEVLNLTQKDLLRPIHSFSKGERQRFNIAVCLARQPLFLLADEPLEGVDAESRSTICRRFRQFADQGGAMLWISHYLDEALPLADRCYVFRNKRIEEEVISNYTIDIYENGNITKSRNIVTLIQVGEVLNELLDYNSETTIRVRKQ